MFFPWDAMKKKTKPSTIVYLGTPLLPSLKKCFFPSYLRTSCSKKPMLTHILSILSTLGGYDMEEKAARAYDLAALKYWGPATHINFPVRVFFLLAFSNGFLYIYLYICDNIWIYFL